MILAGDIGGTNTRLALFEASDGHMTLVDQNDYASREYDDLLPLVKTFLASYLEQGKAIDAACFAVAGPVTGDTAKVTNLPWVLNEDQLAAALQIPVCKLINDFQGTACGIDQLPETDLVTLQEGKPEIHGTRVILGPGTGLGVGMAIWQAGEYNSLASEGGHVDFAPCNGEQQALLTYWQAQLGRVSYESLLSGKGLARIYTFLHDQEKDTPEAELLEEADPAAAITAAAMAGDKLADRSLHLFADILAAQAGNLALTCLARGGVYLAGGIAPKIIRYLQSGQFNLMFCQKSPMDKLLTTIPVKVIMNTRVGLLGAAVLAESLVHRRA